MRDAPVREVSRTAEYVYLVVEGECHVRVDRLAGTLGEGGQVHVRRDLEHDLTSLTEPLELLRFECAFVPFAGGAAGAGRAPTRSTDPIGTRPHCQLAKPRVSEAENQPLHRYLIFDTFIP